jgi:hypothetical protein
MPWDGKGLVAKDGCNHRNLDLDFYGCNPKTGQCKVCYVWYVTVSSGKINCFFSLHAASLHTYNWRKQMFRNEKMKTETKISDYGSKAWDYRRTTISVHYCWTDPPPKKKKTLVDKNWAKWGCFHRYTLCMHDTTMYYKTDPACLRRGQCCDTETLNSNFLVKFKEPYTVLHKKYSLFIGLKTRYNKLL